MTVVQCSESAHRSSSSSGNPLFPTSPRSCSVGGLSNVSPPPTVSAPLLEIEHDAPDETPTMSSYGPRDHPHRARGTDGFFVPLELTEPLATSRHDGSQLWERKEVVRSELLQSTGTQTEDPRKSHGPPQHITFSEFTAQLRQQRHLEQRQHALERRKRVLHKTITLSARLHRVSSWIRDGLVEISKQKDTGCFMRVHQHIQDLIDLSYSQWKYELNMLDPLDRITHTGPDTAGSPDVLARLPSWAQNDLLDLLIQLRSNSRFLVDRFRVLAHSQIVGLFKVPRFEKVADTTYDLSHRVRTKRMQNYSKSLEGYASSFERSNPLSLLLFNLYGTNQSSTDTENQLRLSTWSTVCAELMTASDSAYQALLPQLLDSFASLYEWRARDSVEMLLMDILQRGAFLLDMIGTDDGRSGFIGSRPRFDTPDAQEFFDSAIRDLFAIFVRSPGGFPTGALQFVAAVLKKLPTIEQQMRFRGEFFKGWFLDHFLFLAITFPENEDMLLKFHVSEGARQNILYELWFRICSGAAAMFTEHPSQPIDPTFRYYVEVMIGTIDEAETSDPYGISEKPTQHLDNDTGVSITICLPEIVQVLDALSPQTRFSTSAYDLVMSSSMSTFHATNPNNSGRFNRLRTALLDPVFLISEIHPCQERWLQFDISPAGTPRLPRPSGHDPARDCKLSRYSGLDAAESGALRLFTDEGSDPIPVNGTSYRTDLLEPVSLESRFHQMAEQTKAQFDPRGCIFWETAIDILHDKYPRSVLTKNDSAVLSKIFSQSKAAELESVQNCKSLEIQLGMMEDIYVKIRATLDMFVERFESLRVKLWYAVDVMHSRDYTDANNISRALNNMAISVISNIRPSSTPSFVSSRPITPRSTTSSIFERTFEDTMSILKASIEHGGPKKLADKQIELTELWLQRNNIDNFCKGEERIHRFCMEVFSVSRRLTGETMAEAPILWSSELFSREKNLYDIRSPAVTSAPASTRPASVLSDPLSTTYRPAQSLARSIDSFRVAYHHDDRRSIGSNRIEKGLLPPDLASSIGSSVRAYSTTTAESISSVYTPMTSNPRSMTSLSIHSRAPSVYNDSGLSRFTDTNSARSRFLDKTHQILICLLLSDLGCPVWSLGSETDAMLDTSRENLAVDSRLKQRMLVEGLLSEPKPEYTQAGLSIKHHRSRSVPGRPVESTDQSYMELTDQNDPRQSNQTDHESRHLDDLTELLKRLSQQVEPVEKLATVEEFHKLSLSQFDDVNQQDIEVESGLTKIALRRSSLDSNVLPRRTPVHQPESQSRSTAPTEDQIISRLKANLAKIRPKTLFRDLQYISAFVPGETIAKTPRGKALLHLGLAALAYKDEVCRSMVDVADRMLSQSSSDSDAAQNVTKITEFWMFAAREGNAVAQRELASLYLSRPELLPVMSLPLYLSSKVFGREAQRHSRSDRAGSTRALCLALHWMQQAEQNGDRLARQKVKEISIQ